MTPRSASYLTVTVIRAAATVAVVSSLAGCASSSSPRAGAGGSTGVGLGGAAGGGLGGAGGSGGPDAGAAGGAGGGGSGAGGGGGAGTGGAGALHGGSSARFICAAGATYGNPLTGIGTVMQIMQPNMAPIYSFSFIEGPVWIASLGKIFFSDNAASPTERIIQVTPPSTTASSFMEASGSNGLAIDNDDNLILADQRNQRIVRVSSTTATIIGTPLAASTTFKPNDVIVRSDNNIYVTDPASGFYRISPTGTLSAAMKQVNQPNGIALSLDERTLYVGDVGNQMIYTFALGADGAVDTTSMRTFVMTVSGTVDGMCVDCAGNLYASTSNGVEVFSPAAARLGVVPTGESSNCTFGGADRKTIYVTSRSLLKYVTLAVPGLPD